MAACLLFAGFVYSHDEAASETLFFEVDASPRVSHQ